jgi:Flp pilus assembly protein TadG
MEGRLGTDQKFWRCWAADTDGIIFPCVTVMLVVIIGVSVLALDGARFMYLQTQLQNGADALALSAAAELDRTPTAITRALNAIKKFGNSDPNLKVADTILKLIADT